MVMGGKRGCLPLQRYVIDRRKVFTAEEVVFSRPVEFPLEQKGEGNITEKRVSVCGG